MLDGYLQTTVRHRRYEAHCGRGPAVLYLTNKLRRVPDSGGARRDFELLDRLVKRFDVHLIAISPSFEEERENFDPAPIDYASATLIGADRAYAQAGVPARVAEHSSDVAQNVVLDLVREYDASLIHVNGYFLMHHVTDQLDVPIILQEENIEFELAKDRDAIVSGESRSAWDETYGMKLELSTWRRAAHCIAVAEEDARCMRRYLARDRVHCLPNGIDRRVGLGRRSGGRTDALFVGNYAWPPSRDAVEFIRLELWPAVRALFPSAEIRLAGSGADHAFVDRIGVAPGLRYVGRYERFEDLAFRGTVFLSPLRFGGGNKMKMVEALSLGLPIVATPESLRGFSPSVRRAVTICEDVQAFADVAARLLQDAALRANFAQSALEAARSLPTWDEIADAVERLWRTEMRGDVSRFACGEGSGGEQI